MAYQISRRNPGGGGEEDGGSTFVIEDSTSQLVSVAARLFSRALQARFAEHDVSAGQWPLLLYLWEQDGLSQKQLARRVQIEEPTTTRTLDRMERDGLVRRVRDENDRRRINVFLTERGQHLREELVPYAQQVNALATHGLSAQDKAKINSLLTYMIARLD
ncbi:MAG: MarR family transcriptional regulator [Rhodospirillaceae bacterium]|nr:MarR family transcriptional regulator [Rhodospirillaceae bacterium]